MPGALFRLLVCLFTWFQGYDLADHQRFSLHGKADVKACKGQTVDSARLTLIAGPGIVAENTHSGSTLAFGQQLQQLCGEVHLQQEFPGGVGKTAQGFWMAVGIS